MYINWFTWIIIFIIVYVIQKIGGNENYLNYLNINITTKRTGNYPVITIYANY